MKLLWVCFLIIFNFQISLTNSQKESVLKKNCKNSEDCSTEPFGYVCSFNQTCQCDHFYVPNSSGDKCVAGVGQRCRYDEHCVEGAFCEFQIKCQCKENFLLAEDGIICSRSEQTGIASLHFSVPVLITAILLII